MSKTTDSISSTCVLCCGSIKYYAVGQCNHHICLKCSTRMRVLCEQKHCAVCRAVMPKVISIAKLHPFSGIIAHKFSIDRKAGIAFANPKIQDEFRRLLWEMCPICPLRNPQKNFKDLQDHMRKEHELFYCDLCIIHLKVFSFERKTYSRKDLALHRRKGDGKDTSYRGHPLCEFCDERYFDNDELLRHLRQQHYFCYFCETDGVSNQYYNDYDNLKDHFRSQHYLCDEESCAQEQFTHAFRSDIDLKAHLATMHSNQMSKSQARQMRQIDMQINYPPRPTQRDGGAPGFRGRGRRYYANRDDELSSAIQASMETNRRETIERSDGRRQGREERETKKTKQKKPAGGAEPDDVGDETTQSKTKKDRDGERKGAVAMDTTKETGSSEEKRMRKKGGRTSPQSEEETQRKMKDGTKGTLSRSTESLENVSDKQKSDVGPSEKTEVGKKKKKKNGKTTSDAAQGSSKVSENEFTQSIKKPQDDKPVETVQSIYVPNESNMSKPNASTTDMAELNAKSVKLTWTTPVVKPDEDFPALGQSERNNVGGSTAVGLSFYSALQKMDTKPKMENPPPMPAQRKFVNKEEDFPTLSSIAGILGVDPVPSRSNQSAKTNNTTAWKGSKEKLSQQPAPSKPDTGKQQKKKGKKSAKENQEVVNNASKPQTKDPEVQRKNTTPQGTQTVIPKRLPPGLPPGLAPKCPPTTAPQTVSATPPSTATSSQVGPPPGFGASVSLSNSAFPLGFNVYVPPMDFQERNLQLATRIKAYLGNQEEKFDMFRSISRKYRDDSMTAANYFKECRELLGDNLHKIFNELVSLLPDVLKQQELLSAESDFRVQGQHQKDNGVLKIGQTGLKGKGRGAWKVHTTNESCSCPQCGQVIQRSKLEEHLNAHKEFPSINTGSLQPIHAASPMWPRLK